MKISRCENRVNRSLALAVGKRNHVLEQGFVTCLFGLEEGGRLRVQILGSLGEELWLQGVQGCGGWLTLRHFR